MEKSTHLKTVICGVALVALASVRPALAQEGPYTCPAIGEGSGVGLCITQTFPIGHQTIKYDFGTHAIKITVDVVQPFDLEVGFIPITQGELNGRLNPELAPADCIPYDGATSNTNLGTCGFYHVFNDPLPERDVDYENDVIYTVLWDFPTLNLLHNVRLYRAPLDWVDDFCDDGSYCYTQDITGAVLAVGDSNSDPGVRGKATGFSDFEAVDFDPENLASRAARVWIGLKNSDDVGTRFDLKAVVKKGSVEVSSGELFGALGGSSGFNNATLRTIPLSLPADDFESGDTISLELWVRNSCIGTSHNSGTARLWSNDAAANSRVDEPGAPTLYLRPPSVLGVLGSGPKSSRDAFVGARDPSCNGLYTFVGKWSDTVPF